MTAKHKKRHLVICSQWFPPYTSGGGVAKYCEIIAIGMLKAGWKVTVISSKTDKSPDKHEFNGVDVIRISQYPLRILKRIPVLKKQWRFLRNALYSWNVGITISKIHRELPVDLVEYSEINHESLFHSFFSKDIKHIVRCHTPSFLLYQTYKPGLPDWSPFPLHYMERICVRQASGVTAPSMDLKERMEKWTKRSDVKVLPNLYESCPLTPQNKFTPPLVPPCKGGLKGVKGKKFKILFLGRLERAKGIEEFILSAPLVVSKIPEAVFLIGGQPRSASYLDKIKNMAKETGIPKKFIFLGFIKEEYLNSVYSSAHVYVNPSNIYESFSYTVLDALSCGVPAVVSDMGGMKETIARDGRVFKRMNYMELAQKVIDIYKSYSNINHENIANRAKRLFSVEERLKDFIDYYKEIID